MNVIYTFNCCFILTGQTKRRPRFDTCIIHCSDDESLLISPKDLDSWKSLLKAATVRNHRALLNLAENVKEGEIPHVSYHRKCRSLFTMKRDLESISQKTAAASQIPEFNTESEEQRPDREEPSTSRTYPKIHILCQKRTAYKKGARTRDPLTQCVDSHADASIRKAAIAAGDGRIIEFGDLLQFEDLQNNSKLFVLPKNLSKVQLAREVVTVSQQLDNRDTPSKVKEIQQIGLLIRDAVLSNNTEMSWPPKLSELCENADNFPPELDAFLCTLLTGSTEITTEYRHRVRRLVNSFGQDIIYGVTGGR